LEAMAQAAGSNLQTPAIDPQVARLKRVPTYDGREDASLPIPQRGEEYPYYNDRRMNWRQAREVAFCEEIAVDTLAETEFAIAEMRADIERAVREANLTVEERTCFLMSETHEVRDIATKTGLGAKTVRRRINSALAKLAIYTAQEILSESSSL
jgi:hypothetical protein